jgi:hypothetical protein
MPMLIARPGVAPEPARHVVRPAGDASGVQQQGSSEELPMPMSPLLLLLALLQCSSHRLCEAISSCSQVVATTNPLREGSCSTSQHRITASVAALGGAGCAERSGPQGALHKLDLISRLWWS